MGSIFRRCMLGFAVVALLIGAASAHADTILNYQISGPGPKGTFTASFLLPEHPTPSAGNRLAFDFASLPVDINGEWTNLTVVFDSSWLGGGTLGLGIPGFILFGPQLFIWPNSSSTPTMDMGIFPLYGVAGTTYGGPYTLTVTDPAPVPELSTLALCLVGLAAFAMLKKLIT